MKRRSGYVPDTPLLYPQLSAAENLNLFGLLWGVASDRIGPRAEALLKEVALWDVRDQWVRSYSHGMRQKLSLCAALLHEPQVLLMDEPFTGLDVAGVLWARAILRGAAAAGRCVLFTSHTPEVVDVLADRVALLDGGRIVEVRTARQLAETGGALALLERRMRIA